MITLNDRPVKSDQTAYRELDKQAIIMTPQNSMIHSLNKVGTDFWNNIDGQKSVKEICDLLEAKYEVAREKLEADILNFYQILVDKELVQAAG